LATRPLFVEYQEGDVTRRVVGFVHDINKSRLVLRPDIGTNKPGVYVPLNEIMDYELLPTIGLKPF